MASAIQLGFDGLMKAVRSISPETMKALTEVARELAVAAGEGGVTVTDIRLEAEKRGIIGKTAKLSGLGAVPRQAGLVTTGQVKRSTIPSTHGRYQVVWRLP